MVKITSKTEYIYIYIKFKDNINITIDNMCILSMVILMLPLNLMYILFTGYFYHSTYYN